MTLERVTKDYDYIIQGGNNLTNYRVQLYIPTEPDEKIMYCRQMKRNVWEPWVPFQEALTFDTAPTAGSTNPVTSGGVWDAMLYTNIELVWENPVKTQFPTAITADFSPFDFFLIGMASFNGPGQENDLTWRICKKGINIVDSYFVASDSLYIRNRKISISDQAVTYIRGIRVQILGSSVSSADIGTVNSGTKEACIQYIYGIRTRRTNNS